MISAVVLTKNEEKNISACLKTLEHGEAGGVKFLRLARRDTGIWRRKVHETLKVAGKTETLTVAEFLADIDRYSTLHAQVNFEEGKRSNLLKIILWPKLEFINNYLLRLGFLDGPQGFVVAMLMSFRSYLSWGKLWLLEHRTQNIEHRR